MYILQDKLYKYMEVKIKNLVKSIIENANFDIRLGNLREGRAIKSNLVIALKEIGYNEEEIIELFEQHA